MNKNVYVFGAGYVGLSNGVLLAQHNKVTLVDINQQRVDLINKKQSPIRDNEIELFLSECDLNICATSCVDEKVRAADYVIIATPTNFDELTGSFNTSSIESVLDQLKSYNYQGIVVIRSTVPLGYTDALKRMGWSRVLFVPEFLREGSALYDSLHPSRIVVGAATSALLENEAKDFTNLLLEGSESREVPVVYMGATEAESVKLFSNTYLALRVAFFNELDTYALTNGLDSKKIIEAVGLDPRIGRYYQNPSFGYGGYCLPKDTKQLLSSFKNVPQTLISAIVNSNDIRKQFIADFVSGKTPKTVGIFRLTMKKNSDNFRESAIFDIMKKLKERRMEIIIFEPILQDSKFNDYSVVNDIDEFIGRADIILVNRLQPEYNLPYEKVFTRDMFMES